MQTDNLVNTSEELSQIKSKPGNVPALYFH